MPTLEELLKQAARASRKPARAKTAPLWPMPEDPDLLADMIQSGRYPDEAQTIEDRIECVYRHRSNAIWAHLTLQPGERAPMPWAACLPLAWDPHNLLGGEHREGWASTHWAFDYYPGPNGLQHRINIEIGRAHV